MVFTGQVKSDFLKDIIVPISKRPSVINYAATDFVSLRDSLLEYIQAVYPVEYENFSESDLGVMLIELVAYMGSVFSLKADMLANENYLQTAKLRRNVKKLLGLIGVWNPAVGGLLAFLGLFAAVVLGIFEVSQPVLWTMAILSGITILRLNKN